MSDREVPSERTGQEALELHRRQIRRLLEKDMDGWVDAFADDAVFELPFAPPNYPRRLEGKDAIHDYVKDYPKHIDLQDFPDVVEHPTLDPEVVIVEARTEGRVVATGAPYRVRYVWVVTVRDGKIVHQRDYWNPLTVLEALGGEQALRDAFNTGGD